MKLAIPCINGNVEQKFEAAKLLKVYQIENRIVVTVYDDEFDCADATSVAAHLKSEEINGIICGEIEMETSQVLMAEDIAIYSGAEGDPDKAIDQLLSGDIITPEGEYDHTGEICMEGPNAGRFVRVHYEGTFNDGSVFDSSYERNEPLEYTCGVGLMIEGFDRAVVEMEQGEIRNVHLMPAEAYGEYNPAAVVTYPLSSLPGLEGLQIGQQVSSSSMGITTIMTVIAKDENSITFDANHHMAGKELNFRIELVEVK